MDSVHIKLLSSKILCYCLDFQALQPIIIGMNITLPCIFSSGMVVQMDNPLTVWGHIADAAQAEPAFKSGVLLSAECGGHSAAVHPSDDGHWLITLPPLPAGGPYTLQLSYAEESLVIDDIYSGDVFLCAGQSNMEMYMERVRDEYPEEWTQAEFPLIREIRFPYTSEDSLEFAAPRDDPPDDAMWKQASPRTLDSFSATAYFFAKKWYEARHVPVGIVVAAVGGARIECFLSRDTLRAVHPQGAHLASWIEKLSLPAFRRKLMTDSAEKSAAWDEAVSIRNDAYAQDTSFLMGKWGVDKDGVIILPGEFSDVISLQHGVVYFSKTVTLDADMCRKPATLRLGTIVDADTAYINGVKVGEITYRYPPRKYDVPEGLLKEGENTIVLRVLCNNGGGEITRGKPFDLCFGAGEKSVELSGEWSFKVTLRTSEPRPSEFIIHWQPSGLYNGIIAPLLRAPFRAVLWYQGESNANTLADARDYRVLLPAMIHEWRERANNSLLPFALVSLPLFGAENDPLRLNWAQMRESQKAVLALDFLAIADCYTFGEWNDIHPVNKKGVGEALYDAFRTIAGN